MPRLQSKRAFIEALSARVRGDFDNARICGEGHESVVVVAGSSVYKCYNPSPYDPTGLHASSREIAALNAYDGYAGMWLRVPALKGYQRFSDPFAWNGNFYVCEAEQEYIGGKIIFAESFDPVRLGRAIAEFHLLTRDKGALCSGNLICDAWSQLDPAINADSVVPASLFARLEKRLRSATADRQPIAVHGDLHHCNVIDDGARYALIDYSMMGYSLPEHDIANFAEDDPAVLRGIFKGYADVSGTKLDRRAVTAIHALNLGLQAHYSRFRGHEKDSAEYLSHLEAVLS